MTDHTAPDLAEWTARLHAEQQRHTADVTASQQRRDDLVAAARIAGLTPYRIAQATGLSQPGVAKLLERTLRLVHHVSETEEGLHRDGERPGGGHWRHTGTSLFETVTPWTEDGYHPEIIEPDAIALATEPYGPTRIEITTRPRRTGEARAPRRTLWARAEWERA